MCLVYIIYTIIYLRTVGYIEKPITICSCAQVFGIHAGMLLLTIGLMFLSYGSHFLVELMIAGQKSIRCCTLVYCLFPHCHPLHVSHDVEHERHF